MLRSEIRRMRVVANPTPTNPLDERLREVVERLFFPNNPASDWCSSCGQEIDPECCHCGSGNDWGHPDDHSFVPMGCVCGYAELPVKPHEAISQLVAALRQAKADMLAALQDERRLAARDAAERQREEARALIKALVAQLVGNKRIDDVLNGKHHPEHGAACVVCRAREFMIAPLVTNETEEERC